MSRHKAIVIGSGAGGAPTAARLAEVWGSGVALVEAGRHHTAADFTQIERDVGPKLFVGGGMQASEDGSLVVLQAGTVGGSTVVNDAVCFRPPPEIEARWAAVGVDISLAELAPYVARVEQVMGVTEIPRSMVNRANYLLGLGAARLGWSGHRLRHNSPTCVECGFRHSGCSYGAKRSMDISFVPLAVASGAVLLPETRVHHLTRTADGWRVHTDKGELEAEHVVVCAGMMHTPTILLRSGIQAGEGVQVHMHSTVWADFPDRVDSFNGIPMSYGVTEFSDVYGNTGPGYVVEGVSVQPLGFAIQVQTEGLAHQDMIERYRHMAGGLCLVRSKARGRVTLKNDRPSLDYPFERQDTDRVAHFFERMMELYLAAGASRVAVAHRRLGWVTEPTPIPDMESGAFYAYTAHPFGGANRGTVTDAAGRVNGQENLWVLDGSAIPEALGVNPQITIASLALQGADRLLADAGA